MEMMERIKEKLGFDPLTYSVTNDNFSTGDGDFNPFSILTDEELNYLLNVFRKNAKKK